MEVNFVLVAKRIFLLIPILQFIVIILDSVYVTIRCKKEGKTNGELHTFIKMLFSFSMIIVAFVFWETNNNENLKTYLMFIFLGMTFSAIGDMAMAKLIKSKDRLMLGMTFFSLAHILYILSYIEITKIFQYEFGGLILIFIIGYIVILGVWKKFVYNNTRTKKFNFISLIYSILISTMMFLSLNLAIESKGEFIILTIGATIFMISDFIISLSEIKEIGLKNQSIWVWITYVIAQICIVYNYLLVL